MKFSNLYLIYPDNRVLERAIADSVSLLGETLEEDIAPDNTVTVADNFLYTRGNYEQRRFSANILDSLREALEAALTEELRKQEPSVWAEMKNRLGNILAAQAQQQQDAEYYEKAIQCFHNALEVFDQENTPNDWAATQYNLGTASQALGRLAEDTKPFKAAVDAYTNALLVWKREDTPEDWMFSMHQLGATLHAYGILLKGNRNLQKSVVAYKNALAVLDADRYALELTATHNNRAAVLQHLGESEENPDRIREAINSYDKALTVSMEQQLPVHLSVLCRVNKITAQNVLAELTNDVRLADEVADEFEVILECFPHALQPLCVKHCENQRSKAQSMAP
jgi:tetratricopeptide (TPR) repeat protein